MELYTWCPKKNKKEKKILANIDSETQSFPKNVINRVLFSTLLASRFTYYVRFYYIRRFPQFPLRDRERLRFSQFFTKMNRSNRSLLKKFLCKKMSSVRGNISIKFFSNAPVILSTELFSLLSIVQLVWNETTTEDERFPLNDPTYVKIRTVVRSQLKRISASLSIGKSIRGRGIGLKELKTEWSSFGKLAVILDLALTPQIGRLRPTVSLDALGHSSLSLSTSVSLRPRHFDQGG